MNATTTPQFDAVIFDLDGVITKTASIHTKAWKEIFDTYLQKKTKEKNLPFREFTSVDYLNYVDGKPRYEGVASFLESREIRLPKGEPDDNPSKETICGIGNRKNEAFKKILKEEGVEVYESTKQVILQLHQAGIKLGVASSSKNCRQVLETIGMLSYFETMVDGIVSAKMNLKGKPNPDIFLTACDNLKVLPENAIVVEDAVSGVQAGAQGNFGLTLGIARKENEEELKKNGADYVIADFEDLNGIKELNNLFLKFRKK